MHSILWSLALDWMWSAARPSNKTKHILLRHDPIPTYIYCLPSAHQTWNRYRFNCVWRLNATLYVFLRQTIRTEMAKRFGDKQLAERQRQIQKEMRGMSSSRCGKCISHVPTISKLKRGEMVSVVCEHFHYNFYTWCVSLIYLFIYFCFINICFDSDRYCFFSFVRCVVAGPVRWHRIMKYSQNSWCCNGWAEHVSYLLLIDLWSVIISKLISPSVR